MTLNFPDKELCCKCGCGQLPNFATAKILELTRHMGNGLPIEISSAMRCLDHNKKVGGVSDSLHLYGLAVDVLRWGNIRANAPGGRQAILQLFKRAGWWVLEEASWIHADMRLFFPEIEKIRGMK